MEGHQPYLGDLLTMVINHLLTGMILQVGIIFILKCLRFSPHWSYPSSHNHGDQWKMGVSPIFVSFHLGWFPLPWWWEKGYVAQFYWSHFNFSSSPSLVLHLPTCSCCTVDVFFLRGEAVRDTQHEGTHATTSWEIGQKRRVICELIMDFFWATNGFHCRLTQPMANLNKLFGGYIFSGKKKV